jgi:DNA replication and repair protein RecF
MHIQHLSLTNFRNYEHLEFDVPSHLTVLQGDNAQGKTNLLEAIYLLATAKSHRATTERELLNWSAPKQGLEVARIVAQIQKARGNIQVELALMGAYPRDEKASPAPESFEARLVQKRIKINGINRRAIDLIGQVNAVLFGSQDIDLIAGAPSIRRRYLDLTNSQVNSRYLRALQQYNKVITQRNHLLRLIGEHRAQWDQLDFWDQQLMEHGSYIIDARQLMVAELEGLAQPIHQLLTAGRESLRITYLPSVSATEFPDRLRHVREREIAQGMSVVGPHRDNLSFLVDDVDMNIYGSRGQQRTIAVSLRLAEARFMNSKTGDAPILLLDDVLSELDLTRRQHLLDFVTSQQQIIITTTDIDCLTPAFLAEASLFQVKKGVLTPI